MASSNLPTKVIAGITVVDTALVRAAQEYARAHADEMTYNHVMRSWLFGVAIYNHLRQKDAVPAIDIEAHALSAILHDLGWDNTGELVSKDRRFEVDGAIAASEWINEEQKHEKAADWDKHRVQLVWDSIALHTTASIAQYKETNVEICRLGIMADFQGPNSDASGTLTWDEFNAIKKEFPRHNLASGVRDIIVSFCKTKPATTCGKVSISN